MLSWDCPFKYFRNHFWRAFEHFFRFSIRPIGAEVDGGGRGVRTPPPPPVGGGKYEVPVGRGLKGLSHLFQSCLIGLKGRLPPFWHNGFHVFSTPTPSRCFPVLHFPIFRPWNTNSKTSVHTCHGKWFASLFCVSAIIPINLTTSFQFSEGSYYFSWERWLVSYWQNKYEYPTTKIRFFFLRKIS